MNVNCPTLTMGIYQKPFLAGCEIVAFLIGLAGCILFKITNTQMEPYMDEIFHVKQAQKYCEGKFYEWDPMITTLPGLYVLSVSIFKFVARITDYRMMEDICVTFWLRCINIGFSIGNFIVILLLLSQIHKNSKNYDPCRVLLSATALSLFPTLYFFTFLYYTDPGSTFFVLLTIFLGRQHRHKMAALIGIVAIMFRQTNIIWVFFTAGLAAAHCVIDAMNPEKKDISDKTLQNWSFLHIVVSFLWNGLRSWSPMFRQILKNVLIKCYSYILVGVMFFAFVILNNGIVVGDRTSHVASLHIPQLFYFVGFTFTFSFMHLISVSNVMSFLHWLINHKWTTIIGLLLAALSVWNFTYAHPYLLADNRHYTFYVWSKIYRRHDLVKYILIPFYLFSAWSIMHMLRYKNILWKVLFLLCTILCLVPNRLMEFRYFILPYLLFRLNMKLPNYPQVILELILYAFVNAATVYVFVTKPFKWPDSDNAQRFMW